MPGSVPSLYVEDANELGFDVSSEAEGRPPDHTGSIQAFETAIAVAFRYSPSKSKLQKSYVRHEITGILSQDGRHSDLNGAGVTIGYQLLDC